MTQRRAFPETSTSSPPSLPSQFVVSVIAVLLVFTAGAFTTAGTGSAQAACTPVDTADLLAHWPFDEASGTTAMDVTGHGHDGTLENGTARTAGTPVISGNTGALAFDGVDDLVRVADSAAFGFGTGSFTVTAFVKTGSGNRSVLGNYSAANRGWGLYVYDTDRVNFFGYGDGGTNDTSHAAAVLDDQWHHVAGVYARSGSMLTIDVYVDGALVGSHTTTTGNIVSGSDLLFGRYLGQPHYEGMLDDVRVYARMLTASEIDDLSDGCGDAGGGSSSSSMSSSMSSTGSSISSSSSSSSSSMSSSSVAGAPLCDGMPATVFVRDRRIVGGPMNGQQYFGVLRGTDGDDVIVGTNHRDIIGGKDGNDRICGLQGPDILYGDDGMDHIEGNNGPDILLGGDNDDHLDGGNGRNLIVGGDGTDTCIPGSNGSLVTGCEQ